MRPPHSTLPYSHGHTTVAAPLTLRGRQVQCLAGGQLMISWVSQRQRGSKLQVQLPRDVLHLVHRAVHAPAGHRLAAERLESAAAGEAAGGSELVYRQRCCSFTGVSVWQSHAQCDLLLRLLLLRKCFQQSQPACTTHLRSQTATGTPAWLVSRKCSLTSSRCGYKLRWWVAYRATMPRSARLSKKHSAAAEAWDLWKHVAPGAAA